MGGYHSMYVKVKEQLATSWFSPSITWIPGTEFRLSNLVESSFIH